MLGFFSVLTCTSIARGRLKKMVTLQEHQISKKHAKLINCKNIELVRNCRFFNDKITHLIFQSYFDYGYFKINQLTLKFYPYAT